MKSSPSAHQLIIQPIVYKSNIAAFTLITNKHKYTTILEVFHV